MGGALSPHRHPSSNRVPNMHRPRRGTVTGCIKPDCLKADMKKRQKIHRNQNSEKVLTNVEEEAMDLDRPSKKISTVAKKKSLEDWIRASPNSNLESRKNSSELDVLRALSKKVHPSLPGNEGDVARPEGIQDMKMKRELREISGSFVSAREYFHTLDELEQAAAVQFRPGPGRSRIMGVTSVNAEMAPCPEECGRSRRRVVRFKPPEESHIVVFYSPGNGNDKGCDCGCNCCKL